MFRGIYNFFITTKLRNLNLFDYLEVAEKYGKIHNDPYEVFDVDGHFKLDCENNDEPVFVSVKGEDNWESCFVFYHNLFILFSINSEQGDKIIQIYIKRPEDEWAVPVGENGLDLLNPTNVKVDVYLNYDVSVLKLNRRLSRCFGEEYRSGEWNKSFFKSFNSFLGKVEDYTEMNQIKQAYGK